MGDKAVWQIELYKIETLLQKELYHKKSRIVLCNKIIAVQ